ncbi:MAG: ATP-binding protein [Bacteroidota bacterium]
MLTTQSTYRIAITGPESTGKSELSRKLAEHYNSIWVPEYAREYLSQLNRGYRYEDILSIARGQVKLEEERIAGANKYLFCDTELLVCKIWSEEKFGKCDPWILEKLRTQHYDLYLLCNTDILWKPDPLRENPDDRNRLFNLYQKELQENDFPFEIIQGTGEKRVNSAIKAIEAHQFHNL